MHLHANQVFEGTAEVIKGDASGGSLNDNLSGSDVCPGGFYKLDAS